MVNSNKLISRAHNKITLKYGFVQKTSTDLKKMDAEYKWLDAMSKNIYIPSVNRIEDGYEIRFIEGNNLGEIFWNANKYEQRTILNIVMDFIYKNIIPNTKNFNTMNNELLIDKCESRFNEMLKSEEWNEYKLYFEKYLSCMKKQISKIDVNSFGIMHGDLFFGNTLYDGMRIYFIDPRGYHDTNEIFGSVYYDLIKLSHSVHGLYDQIIFGKSRKKHYKNVNKFFFKKIEKTFGYKKDLILLGEMGLFLSMIPLHSDSHDRQMQIMKKAILIDKEIEWKNLL